jgi:hypothetical protein
MGFKQAFSDSSLFVYNHGGEMAYLLVYVDDVILTATSSTLLGRIIDQLRAEFAIKDLGDLRFFLGVQVQRDADGFSLSQA